MNPPSAIHGAMGRERKPFTYTPGGLDLSEIKSERMAKRLMRNAMNQGVPELPPQPIQSPSTPTNQIPVPNFSALPVQVFPAFNIPANPKSLLRTRSTPDRPRETPGPKVFPPSTHNTNSYKPSGIDQLREALNSNTPVYSPVTNDNNNKPVQSYEYNNNRPISMYEFNAAPEFAPITANTTYGSDAYTTPVLPEVKYNDAEFYQYLPRNGSEFDAISSTETMKKDFTIKPLTEIAAEIKPIVIEDNDETENDDQTVKVVKKQVKKAEKKVESEVQNQNGDQNGEAEAEMVVKLPATKSAAKTETKVEVVKKTLPDGSIEETKTTITKATVDGKTSITTKTETQITPKVEEEVEEVEEEEEEEGDVTVEEVEENGEKEEAPTTVVVKKTVTQETPAVKETVIKKAETSETVTTKKVVVVQNEKETEKEVVEEAEPETTTVVVKKSEEIAQKQEEKQEEIQEQKTEVKQEEVEEVEEEEEEEEEVKVEKPSKEPEQPKKPEPEPEEEEEVEEEEEYEEAEESEDKPEPKPEKVTPPEETKQKEEEEESEYTEEEIESEKEEIKEKVATSTAADSPPASVPAATPAPATAPASAAVPEPTPTQTLEAPKEPEKVEPNLQGKEEEPNEQPASQSEPEPKPQPAPQPENKVPLREPSIPLEKVENVEIKPIGAVSETISKTHTESTEIISGIPNKPSGTLSTQTEYNKIENIVTVNRTTKTLDNSYEQITQQGIPTVRTYFAPGRERVSPTPQPAKPYQPLYTPPQPQPQTERRHSLLLERLSTERQMPSDIYQKQTSYQQQYHNQNYEQQRQWSQEPQSEVVNDSNIKPSKITNQQWYQQSRKENVIYNNVSPSTPAVPSQQWSQPPPQPQPQVQIQPQLPYQQPYEIYTDNSLHDSSKFTSNTYQQNSYPSYTPAPNNWASSNVGSTLSNVNNTQSNQYSYLNKSSSESYQNTSQQYSSSYVPPPWEQDPNYVAPQLPTQTYYQQEQPSTNIYSPPTQPGWKPSPPAGKFTKPAPKSYIPPAPNQSFVKSPAPEPIKRPGSKTYYSEYERRYITVPESTYIPSDAKFQAQPDPSPQYYYDNNEPSEAVEHQWRKELREFTEKTQTTQTQQTTQTEQSSQQITEQTSVHPPWEQDPKYAKVPTVTYTPTPSWSQTLRPQSNRERSFESEYIGSNEWSKTNTLGRSRPLSSYGNNNYETPTSERPRGVSVDRYNPNKYQPPLTIPYDSEHGPVQAHTLDPKTAPHRGHNPNVPAYHARTSAEPREHQQTTGQARNWGLESRATPLQSRSFKYLQWITGTED